MDTFLDKVLTLEQIDRNIYRGITPEGGSRIRIFGGQTISQALRAAGNTVQTGFIVHSLHSYFLLPGNPAIPVLYHVDRLRDGKSFAQRHVKGTQNGESIFTATISFQKFETGFEHQDEMPQVDIPAQDLELVVDSKDSNEATLQQMDVIDAENIKFVTECKNKSNAAGWIKTRTKIVSDELFYHQCAIAYMSDWGFLRASGQPHGLNILDGSIMVSSIDHSMWFHSPFRADDWLLYLTSSPRTGSGRGLVFGKMFNRSGKLVVTCTQEGVLRKRKGDINSKL